MRREMFAVVVALLLPAWARSATLLNNCDERVQTVTLTGSDTPGDGQIWNDNENGAKIWRYEGGRYTYVLSDEYKTGYELTLDRFACSAHFNFYYTEDAGDHAVDRTYVEQVATQLETAWTELANQGFRTPLDLKDDGRYRTFTDFRRIPVLIYDTIDGKSHAGGAPSIMLRTALGANSGTPQHELFHVIRAGYTRFSPKWLNEGLARWSEKFVEGGVLPCDGFDSYRPITFDLPERDYCYAAPFFDYVGVKYGTPYVGRGDGPDVVRAILEEMIRHPKDDGSLAEVDNDHDAMLAIERALDNSFRGRSSGYGNAYKEWAKGNYVDDRGASPEMRAGAPERPRWKEAGEIGPGGNQYVWHDFTFNTRSRGTITIQIRAAAGDLDRDGDDDDLRFRLDGVLLGDWNSANAFDGAELDGKVRTIHIVRRDVLSGNHTLRLEGDEHPVLFAVNVFTGEVPLLAQASGLSRVCQVFRGGQLLFQPCFLEDGDPALLSTTFNLPAGSSRATVLLEGRASSAEQNLAFAFPKNDDDAKVLLDGVHMGFYNTEQSLDGDLLEGDLAAVELRSGALAAGEHTLDLKADGKPYVDHVAVFATPQLLPLWSLRGGRLTSWSTNYHVIPVGAELLPSNEDVLARNNLTIELGTYAWSHDLAAPFYHILLINSAGELHQTLSGADSHGVTHSITPNTLNRLGVGGRVVVVVGTRDASGTYYVRVKR